MKGIGFRPYQKLKALKMWLEDGVDIVKVARRFKCNERSLWRWKALYDGTLSSLENKSKRPHTPHPMSHTQEEQEQIKKVISKQISYNEAYGILRTKYAYSRSYGGFYNYISRHNLRPKKEIEKYVPQPYETPEMLGTKWQLDVKYVPVECNKMQIETGESRKLYQYTIIDEATRERFLFPYVEHNGTSTVDFIKRAITYFGYAPETIQTDNGGEFTNPRHTENTHKHAVDVLLDKLHIKHQLIKPHTPRLNGKVERSHRSDQESFYNHLTFKSFDELKSKMMSWNIRYNNRPHASLRNRQGKKVWLTPLEKRADLLLLLEEKRDEFNKVRFLKKSKTIRQIYKEAFTC